MNYSRLYENKRRGTFDFPIELYKVDSSSPRYQMPLHWHLEYELILVKEGGFRLSLDGGSFPMGPGDCAWVGDGVIHGGTPRDCVYQCVVFDLGTLLESGEPAFSESLEKTLRLKNVLTYICDRYDSAVTLSELAAVAGMNPKYFCRAFSQMTGRTPIDYLNYYRMEQAGEQLAFTARPVTEIALNCGFSDISYFSRIFSRYKGVSPSAYRRRQAGSA